MQEQATPLGPFYYSPLAVPFYVFAVVLYAVITALTFPCLIASPGYRHSWLRCVAARQRAAPGLPPTSGVTFTRATHSYGTGLFSNQTKQLPCWFENFLCQPCPSSG